MSTIQNHTQNRLMQNHNVWLIFGMEMLTLEKLQNFLASGEVTFQGVRESDAPLLLMRISTITEIRKLVATELAISRS